MQWRPPRFIVSGMRKWRGLIQPRETQTLHVPTFQWELNHFNDWFHSWHCASDSCKDHVLPCSNGIPLQDFKRLYLRTLNSVGYRYPENGSLVIGQGQVYLPHKCLRGKFKVPFLFNLCLDDQFRSASFDLQRLKLWNLFTGHTSVAYDKWEWKIDHWLIKSTRHSLPSPWRPSTIVHRPGKQLSLGSRQSLVQEVEHNIRGIQKTLITGLLMHALMYFVILMQIFLLPRHRLKPKWLTISTTWFAEGSTQLVWTQRWRNLTTIRAGLMRTLLIASQRSWWSGLTILVIVSAALLLLLKLACDSQLFCLWVGLPSPAAAGPSPAPTATATATATATTWPASLPWPARGMQDQSMDVWL